MKPNVFFVLLSALVLFASCGDTNKKQDQPFPVRVAQTTTATTEIKKEFPFISKPFRTSELSFRVGGPIDRLEVYSGNHYKRGNIIAEIDSRDFRIHKERSEALYEQAKAEYERIGVLYEKGNVSPAVYEKTKANYTTAKMNYETAVNELNDTKLLAPFNGYVGEVYMEKFQDVKPSQPVLSLIDIDQLKIEVYVTQEIAQKARKLETVQVLFDALPEQVFEAKIVEVSKSTTPNNISYLLTALLANENNPLPSGMSGKVCFEMPSGASGKQVMVPQTALCHRPTEGDYVWVVNTQTNQVNLRKVRAEQLLPNGSVAIASGLQPNETVAVSGLRFLSDGMPVRIK